jgi:serine/threonine protein phosphatase PrpC
MRQPNTLVVPRFPVEASARSERGRRANNEDAYMIDLDHGLFVVADGMGGYEGGEVASRIVVHTVHDFFVQNECDEELTWPWGIDVDRTYVENVLSVAIRIANLEVMARRRGRLKQMGSTVVALAIDGDKAVLAHIGDSRIYRLRNGVLERLTRDHSWIEQLRAMGVKEHPEGLSHIITRAIGFAPDTLPDIRIEPLRAGDAFLLCSDGLSEPLPEETIAALLAKTDACEALTAAAYEAGGSDNITALVVRTR